MIEVLIRWSIGNRFFVLIMAALLVAAGLFSVRNTPIDAIPDLSDVQVIIKTSYPGQAPQVVEDQVTYPLTTAMLSVPGAVTVRGYSFFGDSYVYVIFGESTDLYWARSRVLEYLSQVAPSLPASAKPQLGPDATGVVTHYDGDPFRMDYYFNADGTTFSAGDTVTYRIEARLGRLWLPKVSAVT